jgi:Uri superfamily endonuclease
VANDNILCAPPPNDIPGRLVGEIAAAGVSGFWVTRAGVDGLSGAKGAYLLVMRSRQAIKVAPPGSVPCRLMPDWYFYAGSAWGSGGLRARIRRHFQRAKTVHWHIDRLTVNAAEMAALAVADGKECELVSKLVESQRFAVAVRGFGSSDCRLCESHLLVAAS